MPGFFVTFEGGEGTGKSTQVRLLSDRLTNLKMTHIQTREPGGTKQGEALRTLLVTGDVADWTPQSEVLLNYAARAEHLRLVIRPALERGDIVVCDRFMDSTRAYQGYAGGCDMELIDSLERQIVGGSRPDLTVLLDIDPARGLERAKSRGDSAEVRFEKKGLAFHDKLRKGYLEIARREPHRCKVVSAEGSVDDIAKQVWALVESWINGH